MVIWHNVHRLILTSILVAVKFFDDKYYSNAFFSKVGGVSSKELNRLEISFLSGIQFHLFVGINVYRQYNECLMKRRATSSPNPSLQQKLSSTITEGAPPIHAFGSQLYGTAVPVPMITRNRSNQRTKPIQIKMRVEKRPSSAPLLEPKTTQELIKCSNVKQRFKKMTSPNKVLCYGAALFRRLGTTKLLIRSA